MQTSIPNNQFVPLLSRQPDGNNYDGKTTPIESTMNNHCNDMIIFLVDNGATINSELWCRFMEVGPNNNDISASKIKILEYLLDHGVPVNKKSPGEPSLLGWALRECLENSSF